MFLTFIIFCYFLTEGQIDYVLPLRVGFSYLSLVLLSFSFFFLLFIILRRYELQREKVEIVIFIATKTPWL